MVSPDKSSSHRGECCIRNLAVCLISVFCCFTTACEEDDSSCCASYPGPINQKGEVYELHESSDPTGASSVYYQMCVKKTSALDSCRFRKVDQYIDAAWNCCEPILADIRMGFASADSLDQVIGPLNAYTWCLLNTKPNDYSCDTSQAVKLERQAIKCCAKSKSKDFCIAKYIGSDGKICQPVPLAQSCCSGLPEEETDTLVSRTVCERYAYDNDECVRTQQELCCFGLPESGTPKEITKKICNNIYKSSNQCVNSDYLYEQFKKDCQYGTSDNKANCP